MEGNQAHPLPQSPTLFTIPNISAKKKQSQGLRSSNVTSSTTFRALTFDIELALEKRRREVVPRHGWKRSPPGAQETAGRWTDRKPETDRSCGWMDGVIVSLDDLEVVQDGHDVLRHEDVTGVNSHAGHRDQQGV